MENSKYRLDELKDSRILYEKKIPRFGFAIIFIVLMLLIITAIWMANCKKTFVIRGSGIVESENKNYIMAPYSGKITKLGIKEGKIVSKGDAVVTIKSTEKELQKEQNDLQRKQLNSAKNNLEKQIVHLKLMMGNHCRVQSRSNGEKMRVLRTVITILKITKRITTNT